jgi:hypothetical protein
MTGKSSVEKVHHNLKGRGRFMPNASFGTRTHQSVSATGLHLECGVSWPA